MEIYISVCLASKIVSQLYVSGGISVNATLEYHLRNVSG